MEELLKDLRGIPTASLSDALDRVGVRGFMSHCIRPVFEGVKIVGRAVTTKDVPSAKRGLPLQAIRALDEAPVGSVIVRAIEGADPGDIALWGGLMTLASKVKGVEGVVADGGARDLREIRELRFPVFARSIVPTTSVGRTETVGVNVPIVCAGVTVKPGDIIVGDDDGVVVVPPDRLQQVVEAAKQIDETERKEAEELRQGKPFTDVIRKYARV